MKHLQARWRRYLYPLLRQHHIRFHQQGYLFQVLQPARLLLAQRMNQHTVMPLPLQTLAPHILGQSYLEVLPLIQVPTIRMPVVRLLLLPVHAVIDINIALLPTSSAAHAHIITKQPDGSRNITTMLFESMPSSLDFGLDVFLLSLSLLCIVVLSLTHRASRGRITQPAASGLPTIRYCSPPYLVSW